MRWWAAGDMCSDAYHGCAEKYHGDLYNGAMQPLLELIPPEQARAAAVRAAEEVDAFLLEVSDEVVEMALARADAPNLDRGSHRAPPRRRGESPRGGGLLRPPPLGREDASRTRSEADASART